MKNKILVLGLIGVMALPQVASAAWWNPLTWKKVTPNIEYGVKTPVTESTETEPQVIEKIVEKPVEKIVEKVIKVNNPELQAKIDALIKENSDLQFQLNSKTSIVDQLNVCKADLLAAKSKNAKTESISTYPISLKLDAAYCTAKEPSVAKIPFTTTGGFWQYAEMTLTKNLANPNSWSSEDSVTNLALYPSAKELRLSNRDGTHSVAFNFYLDMPVKGEVDREKLVASITKSVFIPKGLPCQ
jgi:hypothetical protein